MLRTVIDNSLTFLIVCVIYFSLVMTLNRPYKSSTKESLKIHEFVLNAYQSGEFQGVVLVARDGKAIYEGAFGREQQKEMS